MGRKTRQRIRDERIAKKKKEAEIKRRREEAKRAYEETNKQSAGGFGGMGGMPGGIDPSMFAGLMSDPELMSAFSNPKMMGVMQDIMSNPANAAKYQDDPEVMKVMSKIMSMGGGAGGMPGGMGGMGGSTAGAPDMAESAGPTVEEVSDDGGVDGVD